MAMPSLATARHASDDISRDQLELLKAKFDVLQGERKAYFETYEQTKRTNEHLLKDLRDRGKELRRQLADAQRKAREAALGLKSGSAAAAAASAAGVAAPGASGSGGVGSDDAHVAEDLVRKRGEFDKLRHRTAELRAELDRLQGDLLGINNMKSVVGSAGVAAAGGVRRSSGQTHGGGAGGGGAVDDFGAEGAAGDDGGDEAGGSAGSGAGAASGAGAGGTPLQRKVRQLENRLDKTAIKHEEALSIRRTYEQIVKRLRDERVSYDTQIAAMERAIAGKAHDLDELRVLANDSSRAIESAQVELARCRAVAAADRDKRQRELRERDAMARGRRLQAEMGIARERARRDLLAEVAGDLGVSEERALLREVEASRQQKMSLGDQAALIKRKLDAYEQAWRRVKDATGVAEVVDVIAKMAGQVEQHQQLSALSRENVHRLEGLKAETESFKRFLEDLRFSHAGGAASSSSAGAAAASSAASAALAPAAAPSSLVEKGEAPPPAEQTDAQSLNLRAPGQSFDEVRAALVTRAAKVRDAAADTSRLGVSVRVGVAHLCELLAVVREAAGVPPLGDVSDASVADSMAACQHTLATIAERLRLYAEISGVDLLRSDAGAGAGADRADGEDGRDARRPTPKAADAGAVVAPSPQQLARLGLTDGDLVGVRAFNTRVSATAGSAGAGAGSGRRHSALIASSPGDAEAPSAAPAALEGGAGSAGGAGDAGAGAEVVVGATAAGDSAAQQAAHAHAAMVGETSDSRNAMKRQAQRQADSHRRRGNPRAGEAADARPAKGKGDGEGAGAKKRAGPPRHQY